MLGITGRADEHGGCVFAMNTSIDADVLVKLNDESKSSVSSNRGHVNPAIHGAQTLQSSEKYINIIESDLPSQI